MDGFDQIIRGCIYGLLHREHRRCATGRPLTRKDFAILACAVGLRPMCAVYGPRRMPR